MAQDEAGGLAELALVNRAARGDHEAFRCLVLSYEAQLLAYLTQMLGDAESARDVAQETFIAVFHALPGWRPSWRTGEDDMHNGEDGTLDAMNRVPTTAHPLAPWLYRIATNRALSMLRKQVVRRRTHQRIHAHTSVEEWRQDHATRQAEPTTQQHSSMEDSYVARELLREALSHLSEEDAACLVLHFVEGERYGEIATRLGLTGEAVRKRVARALIALRRAYTAIDMEVRS